MKCSGEFNIDDSAHLVTLAESRREPEFTVTFLLLEILSVDMNTRACYISKRLDKVINLTCLLPKAMHDYGV
jgi:hypothetical protein